MTSFELLIKWEECNCHPARNLIPFYYDQCISLENALDIISMNALRQLREDGFSPALHSWSHCSDVDVFLHNIGPKKETMSFVGNNEYEAIYKAYDYI